MGERRQRGAAAEGARRGARGRDTGALFRAKCPARGALPQTTSKIHVLPLFAASLFSLPLLAASPLPLPLLFLSLFLSALSLFLVAYSLCLPLPPVPLLPPALPIPLRSLRSLVLCWA